MLLGCCHCGSPPPPPPSESTPSDPPPSESVPPSESFGQKGPCNACVGGIIPVRMKVSTTKTAGSVFTSCNTEYTGDFVLNFTATQLSPLPGDNIPFFLNPSAGCLFYSSELALRWFFTPICDPSANPSGRRFSLKLTRTNLGGSYRYGIVLSIQYYFGTTGEQINYQLSQDDISLPGDNAFPCLSAMTSTTFVSDLELTRTGLPRTVIVGPA